MSCASAVEFMPKLELISDEFKCLKDDEDRDGNDKNFRTESVKILSCMSKIIHETFSNNNDFLEVSLLIYFFNRLR